MYPALILEALSPAHLYLFTSAEAETEIKKLPDTVSRFARAQGFKGQMGQTVLIPNEAGHLSIVVAGLGDQRNPLAVASISAKLAGGDYVVIRKPDDWPFSWIAAGWVDGAYRFDRYLSAKGKPPRLVTPADQQIDDLSLIHI